MFAASPRFNLAAAAEEPRAHIHVVDSPANQRAARRERDLYGKSSSQKARVGGREAAERAKPGRSLGRPFARSPVIHSRRGGAGRGRCLQIIARVCFDGSPADRPTFLQRRPFPLDAFCSVPMKKGYECQSRLFNFLFFPRLPVPAGTAEKPTCHHATMPIHAYAHAHATAMPMPTSTMPMAIRPFIHPSIHPSLALPPPSRLSDGGRRLLGGISCA